MDPYIKLVIINVKHLAKSILFSYLGKRYASKMKLGIIQKEIIKTDTGEHWTSLKWWDSRKRKYIVAELIYIPSSCKLVYRALSDSRTTAHQLLFDTISHLSIDMNVVFEGGISNRTNSVEEPQVDDLVYEKFQDPT